VTVDLSSKTADSVRSRSDLARKLLAQLSQVADRLGDVSLAVEVQLLKRDLARGHKLLASIPAENDYLSVVTLVEAALASLTWKAYTPQVLNALRHAFDAGTREGPFSFADYDAIRRQFVTAKLPIGPTIELNSPATDTDDGEEE
jgi:hypothetical protein